MENDSHREHRGHREEKLCALCVLCGKKGGDQFSMVVICTATFDVTVIVGQPLYFLTAMAVPTPGTHIPGRPSS